MTGLIAALGGLLGGVLGLWLVLWWVMRRRRTARATWGPGRDGEPQSVDDLVARWTRTPGDGS